MLDAQKESAILKKLAIKKSLFAAFFIGTLVPIVIAKYNAEDHFVNFDLLAHHLITILMSMLAAFGVIFFIFLKNYKCPQCKHNWTYNCIEDDILSHHIDNISFKFFTVRFWLNKEVHLEEYHCSHCNYEKTIKITRKFIKAGN